MLCLRFKQNPTCSTNSYHQWAVMLKPQDPDPTTIKIYHIYLNTKFILSPHFLSKKVSVSCSVMPDSLQPHGLWPTRLLYPWDFLSKATGVGCSFPLQGIIPTQDQTWASYTARRFFTNWATSKALPYSRRVLFLYQRIPVKVFFLKWRNLSKLIQISISNE